MIEHEDPTLTIFTTACPRNCYSTCAMKVEVENGRIRRIEPHEGNRATPGGACLKGLSYVERVHSPERILHPLRRRVGGEFERITWDQANGKERHKRNADKCWN